MARATAQGIAIAKQYVAVLERHRIPVWAAYLFGSYARGHARPDSDIDIAIISPAFSGDRLEDRLLIEPFRWQVNLKIEQMPFTVERFRDDDPFASEIKQAGIRIK